MIVKVQLPLFPSDAPALIYGKSGRWIQCPAIDQLPADVLAAMGDDKKAYFRAVRGPGSLLTIGPRVRDRDW